MKKLKSLTDVHNDYTRILMNSINSKNPFNYIVDQILEQIKSNKFTKTNDLINFYCVLLQGLPELYNLFLKKLKSSKLIPNEIHSTIPVSSEKFNKQYKNAKNYIYKSIFELLIDYFLEYLFHYNPNIDLGKINIKRKIVEIPDLFELISKPQPDEQIFNKFLNLIGNDYKLEVFLITFLKFYERKIKFDLIKKKKLSLIYLTNFIDHKCDLKENTNKLYLELDKKFSRNSIQKALLTGIKKGEKIIPPEWVL